MNDVDNRVARNKELADKFEKYLHENGTKSFYENPGPILREIGFDVDEKQLSIIRTQLDNEKKTVEYLTAPAALRVVFYVL
ncbi:MAG: hypothetical protein ACXAC6_01830 [Candidatus Hodarchaeales archaeon]|jgi:hypothetical protein